VVLGLFYGSKFGDINLKLSQLTSATFNFFLLALNFGALAFFIGSATGSRGLSIGLSTAFAVISFLINGFYRLVDQLDTIKEFSPFYHYSNQNALIEGIDWASALLLVWASAGLVILSIVVFARRDLKV
jgi:ABC-2 type transport system permease protein